MATVSVGTRLVLRTASGVVTLRALRDVALINRWSIPVMAPLRALQAGDGVVEIATDNGPFSAPAHLAVTDGVLQLLPGSCLAPAVQQRRDDVRGRLSLPLRAVAADGTAERVLGGTVIEGVTLDVSAGGVGVDLHPRSVPALRGCRLYVELTLPTGDLVPAVVSVVQLSDRRVHARFVDIAPVDTERLARLVFQAQRPQLAARARARDESGR